MINNSKVARIKKRRQKAFQRIFGIINLGLILILRKNNPRLRKNRANGSG